MSSRVVMTHPTRQRPSGVLDPSERARAKAMSFLSGLVHRYESELDVIPTSETGIVHIAIVRTELEDLRCRLARLQRRA